MGIFLFKNNLTRCYVLCLNALDMIFWDEELAEVLDEAHTRRSWWLAVRQEESVEYANVEQVIQALEDFELPYVAV